MALVVAAVAGALGAAAASAAPPWFFDQAKIIDNGALVGSWTTGWFSGSIQGEGPFTAEVGWARCDSTGQNCVEFETVPTAPYAWRIMRRAELADVGHTIRFWIRGTDVNGESAVLYSPPTAVVRAVAPTPSSSAVISLAGIARDGEELQGTFTGTWWGTAPLTFVSSWERCDAAGDACSTIPASNADAYAIRSIDIGHTLRYAITATNAVGDRTTIRTEPTAPVEGIAPAPTATPTITGPTLDGETLHGAYAGGWTGSTPISVTRRWERCDEHGDGCVAVDSPGESLELDADDVGHTIRYRLSASGPGGSASTVSAPTAPIDGLVPAAATAPVVEGLTREGEHVGATPGRWTGTGPIHHAYAWEACGADGAGCRPLVGQHARQLRLTPELVGHTVRVVVRSTGRVGYAEAVSAPTAVIAGRPPVNLTAPRATAAAETDLGSAPAGEQLAHAAIVGARLAVDGDAWDGTEALITNVEWQRCTRAGTECAAIEDANDRTYPLAQTDVGRAVRAVVTATNIAGAATVATEPVLVLAQWPARPPVEDAPREPAHQSLLSISQPRASCTSTFRHRLPIVGRLTTRGTLPGQASVFAGATKVLDLLATTDRIVVRSADGAPLGAAHGIGAARWLRRTPGRVSVRAPGGRFLLAVAPQRKLLVIKGRTCRFTANVDTSRLAGRADRGIASVVALTDDAGAPISGASVSVKDGQSATTLKTDEAGRIRLATAARNGSRRVTIAFAGDARHRPVALDIEIDVRGVTTTSGSVSRRTVRLTGSSLGSARTIAVEYLVRPGQWRNLATTSVDQSGRWTLTAPTPKKHAGTTQLVVRTKTPQSRGFAARTSSPARLDIAEGS